ncbi:hypothetical protein QIS99_28230 [Streptomyces sp. B-S-A8]|uniref:Type II secretion system protein GspF domain-containing protein n=1 Tax=Streptomyces solicavernae TaxID=3043614 RepID=A0ABT6S031_9ACTN|nr:hypothetical protein [Streptomyces sp. B-S-A8]MDI3390050.1 hypothetical protein [Streptomyces sp. B-S-A8]
MISPAALITGALIGGGLYLLLTELLPARPDADAVLDRLDGTTPPPPTVHATASGSTPLVERTGYKALASFGHLLGVARSDLEVLGRSPAEHMGTKILGSLAALAVPQVFNALLLAAGAPQLAVPLLVVSIVFAVIVWFNADHEVRANAREKRLEFRFAVASVLERAQLVRSANVGVEAALLHTVQVGDHWILHRMRAALNRAELAGIEPWEALKQLGDELDIPELASPAESFSLAGSGAKIIATLDTQAKALRTRLRTDKQAEASGAFEKLPLPSTVVFAITFAAFAYPAVLGLTAR